MDRLRGQPWSLACYRHQGVQYRALTLPCAHCYVPGHIYMFISYPIPQIMELSAKEFLFLSSFAISIFDTISIFDSAGITVCSVCAGYYWATLKFDYTLT